MSKMEGLRAMREARNQEAASRAAKPAATASDEPRARSSPAIQFPAATREDPTPTLCGHRAISGRTCTRDHGHTSKSHRYA
jgi:hypothetical protein